MTLLKLICHNKVPAIIALVALAEILSLFSYLTPVLIPVFFIILAVVVLAASLKDLRYGIFILLAELFIGGKGYLFFLEVGDNQLSIRIAFWLIIMAVWSGKKLFGLYKEKKNQINRPAFRENLDLIIFFGFLALALINGFLNHNGFRNIFFDFNGWLYFLLAFPILDTLKTKDLKILFKIFIACVIWVSAKSLIFFYAFSHFNEASIFPYYRWIRDTGIGEITLTPSGFYRIFFQSQVYALAGIFIVFGLILPKLKDGKIKKDFLKPLVLIALFLSVILISFSRSFWVGLAVGLFLIFITVFLKFGLKASGKLALILSGSAISGFLIIFLTAYFPLPKPIAVFGAKDFTERIGGLDESGASSRVAQLAPLWNEIKSSMVIGRGFGKTVTYKSFDPRVLESSPDGRYTTYAFEWGWLDIWLKLGLIGLLAYIILIARVSLQAIRSLGKSAPGYEKYKYVNLGIIIGLASICATSVFSPYLNHPLGIGYLILTLAVTHITQKHNLSGE